MRFQSENGRRRRSPMELVATVTQVVQILWAECILVFNISHLRLQVINKSEFMNTRAIHPLWMFSVGT